MQPAQLAQPAQPAAPAQPAQPAKQNAKPTKAPASAASSPLQTTFNRYDYNVSAAILLTTMLVMTTELVSEQIRRRLP